MTLASLLVSARAQCLSEQFRSEYKIPVRLVCFTHRVQKDTVP